MTKIRTRRPLSLTTRVMIAVALAIGLSLFVIGHLVQNVVERHFAEQDAGELVVMTSAVERALLGADNEATRLVEALSHAVSGHHGVYFQVWDMDGNLIYGPDGSEFVKPINNFLWFPTLALIICTVGRRMEKRIGALSRKHL